MRKGKKNMNNNFVNSWCMIEQIIFFCWLKQGLRLNHNVHWLLRSVPKFVDVGGKRHPNANHFPLSPPVFKPNFPLPIPLRRSNCGNGCFTCALTQLQNRYLHTYIIEVITGYYYWRIFLQHSRQVKYIIFFKRTIVWGVNTVCKVVQTNCAPICTVWAGACTVGMFARPLWINLAC